MPNPKYRVTAECLNFRKKPSIDSEVIKCIKKGVLIDCLGVSDDKYWIHTEIDGQSGWLSHKYLKLALNPEDVYNTSFPWLRIAQAEIGVKEIAGSEDNPRIVSYLKSTNLDSASASKDETYWCSAFVNWCVERSGYEGTDSAWAKSWLNWGKETKEPTPGCIVVFSRGDGHGHVGFFMKDNDTTITVLGGNQSDSVNLSDYPKSRLLGYRSA